MRLVRVIACVVVAVTLLAAGCAGSLSQSDQAANENVAVFETPRFLLSSPIGPVSVTVAAEGAPGLPGKPDKELLSLLLVGAASIPLGLVAPPLYASALIVGGGMVLTGSAGAYGTEQMNFNTVGRAVKESDFPAALTEALRGRALPPVGHNDPAANATVAVQGWGVVSESGKATDRHCFVAAVELSISRDRMQVLSDRLQLTLVDPSTDAPPVQCAKLWKFAEDNGRLVRETSRDYAEVLALMVTERLRNLE